jgi:uncharacterized membrane protein YesL
MMDKKKFGVVSIYNITEHIWCFLLANFYFLIMNIPFILAFLLSFSSGITDISMILFLCMIPIGPALVALLSVMGELVREGDVQVSKKFFQAYTSNFFEALFFWCFELGILAVLYIDILFGTTKSGLQVYNYILIFMGFFLLSMSFYIFPIVSRFHLRIIDVLRLSLAYSIKKFLITILNYISLIALFMLQIKFNVLMLFVWSILCYLIMFYERNMLKEIEYKLTNDINLYS